MENNSADGMQYVDDHSWNASAEEHSNVENDTKKLVYSLMLPIVLCLCFLGFIVSGSVVCAAPYIKRPMTTTIRLTLSLSAANAAFSIIVFTAIIIQSYLPFVHGVQIPVCYKLGIEALRLGVILVQVFHLISVALIHYMGTLKPLHYQSKLTPGILKATIAVLWIVPIIGMFMGFSSVPGQGFQSEGCNNNHFRLQGVTFRYIWACIFFGPTVLLVGIYGHIFFILRKRGKNIFDPEQRKNLRKNIKTVKTTALIVVSFLVGWCPAVIAFLIVNCEECLIQIKDLRINIAIFSTSYILFILKVFIDTFIYALRLPEIRDALKSLHRFLCGKFCCRKSDADRNQRYGPIVTRTLSTRSTLFTSVYNSDKDTRKCHIGSSCYHKKPTMALVELRPLYRNDSPRRKNNSGQNPSSSHFNIGKGNDATFHTACKTEEFLDES